MKRISIVFVLLLLCALTASAIGPRSPAGSGGGTFTGGTLSSDLIMGDGSEIQISTGSAGNLSLRLRSDPDTGMYGNGSGGLLFASDGTAYLGVFPGLIYITTMSNLGNAAGRFRIEDTAPTGVIPIFTYTGDTDSGIGRQASGKPSLISDGVECVRVASSGTQIFQPLTSAAFKTDSGTTASLATNATETIVVGALMTSYMVFATGLAGDGDGNFSAGWLVTIGATNVVTTMASPVSSLITCVMDGNNICLQNLNASPRSLTWTVLRIK